MIVNKSHGQHKKGPSIRPGSLLKPHIRVNNPVGKTTDIGGRVLNRIAR
jgi:hypothetical protein